MKRFNIRVYGLWIENGHVLICKETVKNQEILKFPGGGMEFEEGTIDCLKREWQEELNCEIEVIKHFYTTDFYQPSAFDDSRVISIYYEVRPTQALELPVYNGREHFYHRLIDASLWSDISLPIDKVVTKMLLDNCLKTLSAN
jgi:ADP-ribose pyrophosphatase YjhB (NUDIX family)